VDDDPSFGRTQVIGTVIWPLSCVLRAPKSRHGTCASPHPPPLFVGTTGITESRARTERAKFSRTVISPAFWGVKANHEVKAALLDWLFARGAGRVLCDVDHQTTVP